MMTSLYRRATPSQARILRIVEGAVKNAMDVHPDGRGERFARSVAKRAAGTLTAQWPDVLAAKSPSESAGGNMLGIPQPSKSLRPLKRRGRGASQRSRRSPLHRLRVTVGILAGEARRAGQSDRLDALVEVLRLIAASKAGPTL